LHGYLRQPYPVGDACQIVSGLDFPQRMATHNRVSLVVKADALKPWQSAALGALAEESKGTITVTNISGILLLPFETFVTEPHAEAGST
ncbi:MAG: hypothetical protein ACRDV9_14245, partial [Acidimicrobiia bacterium]